MDSFLERIRESKYFAIVVVIGFAFLTALIFAVLSFGSLNKNTIRESVDDTQSQQTSPDASGTSASNTQTSGASQSPLDRIISVFTGKSTQNNSNTPDGSNTTSPDGQPQGSTTEEQKQADAINKTIQASNKLPDIRIDKYVLVTDIPAKPDSMKVYKLRGAYTDLDVADLATRLGFQSIDAVEKLGFVSQLYDLGNGLYLGFDRQTGNFNYQAENGFAVRSPGSSPLQTAKNLLAQLGIDEPGINAYATYKRTDAPGSIFVELHRDWSYIGAPILNPVGMLNLTPDERLDSLSFTSQPDNTHKDAHIVSTSDNTDGFSRPNTFNTISIELSEANNTVKAVSSNIPRIESTHLLDQASIMSPIDAYNKYKQGQTTFGLTSPAGAGTVSLSDVFSDNMASTSTVDVTDFELIYASAIDSGNDWWCPSYAFRSFGKVQTGFEAQFAHTVPASLDPRCQTAILGTHTERSLAQNTGALPTPDTSKVLPTTIVGGPNKNASSLQYGSLGFKVNVIIDTDSCPPNFNHSYTIKDTADFTDYIAWIDENATVRPLKLGFIPRKWYFVRKKKPGTEAKLESLNPTYTPQQLFRFRSAAMSISSIGDRSLAPIDPKLSGLQTISCQHIVTASPWIHLYSNEPTEYSVSIDPVGGVSYVQPAFTRALQQTWDITTSTDKPTSLFWEYNRFNMLRAYEVYLQKNPQSNDGFVVATTQLKDFMGGLSLKMGLNSVETQSVLAELNRQSMRFDSPFVHIKFVDQGFLDESIPLSVTPQPESVHRIYFELKPLSHFEKVSTPSVPYIKRTAHSMLVETGFIVVR